MYNWSTGTLPFFIILAWEPTSTLAPHASTHLKFFSKTLIWLQLSTSGLWGSPCTGWLREATFPSLSLALKGRKTRRSNSPTYKPLLLLWEVHRCWSSSANTPNYFTLAKLSSSLRSWKTTQHCIAEYHWWIVWRRRMKSTLQMSWWIY